MKSIVSFILRILSYFIQLLEFFIVAVIAYFIVGWFGRFIGYEDIFFSIGSFIKGAEEADIGFWLFAIVYFLIWIYKAEERVSKFHNNIVDNIISKIFKN